MMNAALGILWLRRPSLNYVSPGVCEASFSGSGFPIIFLDAFAHLLGPTGLALGGTGNFRLSWNNYPGALCFSVYKAVDELQPFGAYTLIAECITDNFIDLDSFGPGVYRVTAITPEGESDPSDHILFEGAGFDTVFLTVQSDPAPGVPIELGPFDLNGASDGTTAFAREYAVGRIVHLTAPLTDNLLVFQKWQKDGVDFSEESIIGFTLVADTDMTAFYVCGGVAGTPVPANFTLGSPTSLGVFAVAPNGVAVLISSSATAANYSFIYKGGSLQDGPGAQNCSPDETFPFLCAFPPGYEVEYNNGAATIDISSTPSIGVNCVDDQATVESLVPLDRTDIVGHTGGSLAIRWTGSTEYTCGDSCPVWEVIQGSGLITQPASYRIRDFNLVGPLIAPPALWNIGAAGCVGFNAADYPLETDPTQVEWDGTSIQGFLHSHNYGATNFDDSIDEFELSTGERIAINGFAADFAQVNGPRTLLQIQAEVGTFLTDPIPVATRYWFYVIWGPNFVAPFWAGVKIIGDTFVGQYQRISCACPASAPDCIYLEAGD